MAPEWILTCAHVVQEANGEPVQVWWQKRELEAIVARSLPNPYDLALLQVKCPSDVKPPCVHLDKEIRSRDPLYLFGYPDEGDSQGEPRTFYCDGITGSEIPSILFNLGQVRPGMSGSPLLNQRTGKVCGIVKFTHDRSIDLGGGAVPAAVILAQFPELVEQQRSFHQHDQRWSQRMQGAIAANATTLPSTRATLALSTYDPTTWVGRDTLIATLSRKPQEHCRILAIIGITGIGKTALAERLVLDCLSPPSSSPTRYFARLNFDDRALPHDFITAATTLLPKLGHATTPDDQKDPQRLLARLLQILRSTPYLVQIDSLEMLLEGDDEQGWTTFKDELWLAFFQQLLAGDECQSQFILTSQALPEALEIAADRYPRCWHRQELGGLGETEQLEIFQKNGLEPDESAIDYLKRLGKLYAGHPLVLQVIAKDILDRPFHGNVAQYWQRYQAELDALERDRPSRRNAPRSATPRHAASGTVLAALTRRCSQPALPQCRLSSSGARSLLAGNAGRPAQRPTVECPGGAEVSQPGRGRIGGRDRPCPAPPAPTQPDPPRGSCEQVLLVCDHLNTHTKGAFYEVFEPERARQLVRRLQFCQTPKHGSWLNIAENELSSLTRQYVMAQHCRK